MKKGLVIFYTLIFSMVILSTGCKKNLTLLSGGYTEGVAEGFSVFSFDVKNGNLELKAKSDAGSNPSYFCFSEDHSLIYCLNEVDEFKGQEGGGITTLKYNSKTGRCEKLGELLVPFGGPCYISRSADSRYLFLANYGSASIAVVTVGMNGIPEGVAHTILYEDDSTNVSHPHMIQQDPAGKHVYVTDLGLDRILIYDLDTNTGRLNQRINGIVDIPEGSGPRHFTFSKDGSILYLINELGSTIMVFAVDETGGLKLIQTVSTIADDFQGKSYCADVHIRPDGRFLYGSNRGENSIVAFKINIDGSLSVAGRSSCGGNWPRNFVIDNTGRYILVANQRSDQISVFSINENTGVPEGPIATASMKAPACLKFLN